MTEKRYFQREFEELYYIIDSTVISEEEFDERVEYEGYSAFEDSLTGEEIVELLNENEELKQKKEHIVKLLNKKATELYKENKQLKQSNQKAIEFILDGIVEMHDGKRDYAETIFNKAIRLLKGDDVE